jgi:hypothetical protein
MDISKIEIAMTGVAKQDVERYREIGRAHV